MNPTFYSAAQSITLQALYMLRHIRPSLSVGPSICLSVRHTLVLCQTEGTQRDAVFTVG